MSSGTTPFRGSFRTIGSHLTIWGAGITLAICALLCAVLYAGLATSLLGEIDSFLEGEVREFMLTVNAHPQDDAGLEQAIRLELGSRAHNDLEFRLFDEHMRLIVTSEPDDPIAGVWKAPDGWDREDSGFVFRTVRLAGGLGAHRTCSLGVKTDDGRTCTAQASYTLDRMDASLATFRRICGIGLAVAAFLSFLSGRGLARRSLRPIQAVTETANRIGAGCLSERIPQTGTGDELDRLAATLNNMLDRIEQHVRRIRQFTADASHELRSPLAALRGSAEVALSKARPVDELRQVLEESIEHYDRLSQITEDLLLLARADAGHHVGSLEPVRLDDVVATVVDFYAPLAQDRGIDLSLRSRDTVTCRGDRARLQQLVGNLLDNAIKFSRAGDEVRVSITNGNNVAKITIADSGQGIAAEHLPHVFDRFYRVDQARSTNNAGTGLGLPICRAIVDAHRGTINLSSVQGEGTIVTASIPIEVHT